MKHWRLSVLCVVALLLLVLVGWSGWTHQPPLPRGTGVSAAPPPIVRIQGMSHLANTKVHITDTIQGENAHYRGRWSLHGEVLLGTDLSRAEYVALNPHTGEAVLRLPEPDVMATKVDHERSEELYLSGAEDGRAKVFRLCEDRHKRNYPQFTIMCSLSKAFRGLPLFLWSFGRVRSGGYCA